MWITGEKNALGSKLFPREDLRPEKQNPEHAGHE
jgi:hypothetical protein